MTAESERRIRTKTWKLLIVLGVALAVMLPSLVQATVYVLGTSSSTLSATGSVVGFATCTAYALSTADFSIVGGIGSGAGALSSPVSMSLSAYETGGAAGSGYEYLVQEVSVGCYNIPFGTTEYFAIGFCGIGATISAPSITTSGTVTGASCTAPGTVESAVGADWVALDASVGTILSSGIPSALSCGTDQATDQAVAALDSVVATSGTPYREFIYGDQPTIAGSTAPSATYDYESGPVTGGSCPLQSQTFAYTVQNGGSNMGKITIPNAPTTTGSCSTDTCGDTIAFTDACTAAAGASGTCGGTAASTMDTFLTISIVLIDEDANGLTLCKSSACTWSGGAGGSSSGGSASGVGLFEMAWTTNI